MTLSFLVVLDFFTLLYQLYLFINQIQIRWLLFGSRILSDVLILLAFITVDYLNTLFYLIIIFMLFMCVLLSLDFSFLRLFSFLLWTLFNNFYLRICLSLRQFIICGFLKVLLGLWKMLIIFLFFYDWHLSIRDNTCTLNFIFWWIYLLNYLRLDL